MWVLLSCFSMMKERIPSFSTSCHQNESIRFSRGPIVTNKEFAKKLEERTRKFASRVIEISKKLPPSPEGNIIKDQFTKAGTSIGANYREANRARSQRDFKHKMHLCETECAETQYWFEVIGDSHLLPWSEIAADYEECCQLLGIFTSANAKIA